MTHIPPFEPRKSPYSQIEIYSPIFARNLRYILASRGLLRADVSETTGIPENLIENYMYRGSVPDRKGLELIAKALDVNEYWLAGHDVTPETYDAKKLSDDKNRRSKVVDILYNRMESLSVAEYAVEDFTDSCNLSLAMGAIAKAISYLEK